MFCVGNWILEWGGMLPEFDVRGIGYDKPSAHYELTQRWSKAGTSPESWLVGTR